MIRRRECATLLLLALASAAAQGQGRYRVLAGSRHTMRGALLEFRPCVPAEGSDCGARIDRIVDFAQDSSFHAPPQTISKAALWNDHDSLAVERGWIVQRTHGAKSARIRDARGEAIALALAPDAPYAFILLAGQGRDPDVVVMYDTDTRSVIASCALREGARSVGLVPMR